MSVSARSETLFVATGTRFGRYEIVAPIGRGGMGEVYRARDTELHRDVALKILLSEYGDDPERLRRFEQEGRAMGQLSHPNIVAVYDVGRSEVGTPYVVTELLEGETLREVLGRGAVAPARASEYALQIARGLAAAHAKNIVHRDLKPGNLFVTTDGLVKILDFGLAKLVHPEWETFRLDESTLSMTAPGLVIGTVAYMAPEQLEGAPVDFRSDIFSFGAVVYEMFTGSRPFSGSSPASLVAAVLREDPVHLSTGGVIPNSLLQVIRRCLEKRPAGRFQSTRDLVFALEQHVRHDSTGSITLRAIRAVTTNRGVRRTFFASLAIGLSLTLLLLTTGSPSTRAGAPIPAKLVTTRVTTGGNVLPTDGSAVAVSPDGVYVAYIRAGASAPTLMLRHVATGSEVELRPAAWYDSVSISPDRNYVYYTVVDDATAAIRRVPLLGGEPRTIAENVDAASPFRFSRDGSRIVFTRSSAEKSSVWIAGSDGSGAREVVERPRKEMWFHGCAWSFDEALVSCSIESAKPMVALVLIDVTNGTVQQRDGVFARRVNYLWVHEWIDDHTIVGIAGGHLMRFTVTGQSAEEVTKDLSKYSGLSLSRDAGLYAVAQSNAISRVWSVPFDGNGAPRQLISGFNTDDGKYGIAPLSDGRFIYSAASTKSLDLWMSDANGERKRLLGDDVNDEVRPCISPDETSLAFLRRSDDSAYELWIADLHGEHARKLTDHAEGPAFGADGKWIYFTRNLPEGSRIFRVPTGGGEAQRLSERQCAHVVQSPDGRYLLANCEIHESVMKGANVAAIPSSAGGPELTFKAAAPHPWRPDSSGFAYVADERHSVMFQPLDGSEPRKLASFPERINALAWQRDGSSLLVSTTQTLTDAVLLNELK